MFAVCWPAPFPPAPFSRLLELKNTKTAGRDFFAEVPTLGFRVLEFEFAPFLFLPALIYAHP
ncbi:hypothetical protein, partial [Corynebacterium diphtheriae]|uniref:hypothetical protein n=1 Tax=Corynebacterium diphtheriae TaxID=1717 RepID=UPI001A7E7006